MSISCRLIRALAVFALSISFSGRAWAQDWDVQVKSFGQLAYQGKIAGGWSGGAVAASYYWKLGSHARSRIETGAETGFVSWGNQALLLGGYQYRLPLSPKTMLLLGAQTGQGVALFRPRPLYVGTLGLVAGSRYQFSRRLAIGLQMGLRYYTCPAYKRYSSLYRYWDFPIEVHLYFTRKRG